MRPGREGEGGGALKRYMYFCQDPGYVVDRVIGRGLVFLGGGGDKFPLSSWFTLSMTFCGGGAPGKHHQIVEGARPSPPSFTPLFVDQNSHQSPL